MCRLFVIFCSSFFFIFVSTLWIFCTTFLDYDIFVPSLWIAIFCAGVLDILLRVFSCRFFFITCGKLSWLQLSVFDSHVKYYLD